MLQKRGISVSRIDDGLRRQGTQLGKRSKKCLLISAVEVASAVAFGKQGVAGQKASVWKHITNRSLCVSGRMQHADGFFTQVQYHSVRQGVFGRAIGAVHVKKCIECIFVCIFRHVGVLFVNIGRYGGEGAQAVQRYNVVKMPVR